MVDRSLFTIIPLVFAPPTASPPLPRALCAISRALPLRRPCLELACGMVFNAHTHTQALLESVYAEQEGTLENMLWGGKENEEAMHFLETCFKSDAAPKRNLPPPSPPPPSSPPPPPEGR